VQPCPRLEPCRELGGFNEALYPMRELDDEFRTRWKTDLRSSTSRLIARPRATLRLVPGCHDLRTGAGRSIPLAPKTFGSVLILFRPCPGVFGGVAVYIMLLARLSRNIALICLAFYALGRA